MKSFLYIFGPLFGLLFLLTVYTKAEPNSSSEPRQIVLTWQGDTQTTMTITWRTDEANARTYGIKLIEDAAKSASPEKSFVYVRTKLLSQGWEEAGYDSPEEAFIALAIGVKNYTGRDANFAYQFLLNNWTQYTENVGLEQELLPDRERWNETYDGVSENRLIYSSGSDLFEQADQYSGQELISKFSSATPESYTFPETSAWLHRVKLTGLDPGQTYSVLIKNESGTADPFTFRTAPTERDSLTFIAGADTQSQTRERKEMTALAASLDPEFVLISGDIVMRGMAENEWDAWFDEWHDLMITEEGRRVPVLPALGNHDVRGWIMGDFETDAAFYANRFNLPAPEKYYVIEYGDGLVLISLDTGHTSAFNEELDWFVDTGYYEGGPHRVRDSHDGQQANWLENTLQYHEDRPWIMAHYHVNAFATSPHYWEKPRYGRPLMHEHWIPLFEQYGLDLVHEGHGHRLKRTKPIKNLEIDDEGVVYIGEGGWGTHMGVPEDMWFVADKGSNHHFWKLSLNDGWSELTGWPVKWIEGNAVRGEKFTIEKNPK
jgi:acid phosphatase type 7